MHVIIDDTVPASVGEPAFCGDAPLGYRALYTLPQFCFPRRALSCRSMVRFFCASLRIPLALLAHPPRLVCACR